MMHDTRLQDSGTMKHRRRRWMGAVCVAACLALMAMPSLAQKKGRPKAAAANGPSSAYKSLDDGKLAGALRQLRMDELLDELVRQGGDSKVARLLQAESMIARAQGMNDPIARDKLLAAAVDLLKKLIADADPKSSRDLCDLFELRFKLARTMALDRGEMYALRLLYLQGGPPDVQMLRSLTEEAAGILAKLERDVEAALMDWRVQPKLLVTRVPWLEDFKKGLRYWSSWVFFYRGMTLAEGTKKKQLLGSAIFNAESFADGSAATGVKFPARLLIGMSNRELNKFDEASKHLQMLVGSPRVPDGVKIQAMFEVARNGIERGKFQARGGGGRRPAPAPAPAPKGKGKPVPAPAPAPGGGSFAQSFKQADKAIDDFEKKGKEILGQGGEIQIDVMVAMLRNYLFESWSKCVTGPEKTKHVQAAQGALLKFVSKYSDRPEVVNPFLKILAEKFRDREDYDNLDSMILLAMAVRARGNNDIDKSEKLLKLIVGRDDEITTKVRPQALWYLALIRNDRNENLASAKLFLELAQKYPKHDLARQAVRNAVIIFNSIVQERRRKGVPAGSNVREEYVAALDVLLNNPVWAKEGDTAKWNFDRGWQCMQLAEVAENARDRKAVEKWIDKALKSFPAVPRTAPEYRYARHLELQLRVKRILSSEMEESVQRIEANSLVTNLKDHSEKCRAAALKLKAQGNTGQMMQDLMKWGAKADLGQAEVFYRVLREEGKALSILSQIPGNWPDRESIVQEAAELEIRWLVERGQVDQAIKKVDEFSKKYPEEADQLVQLVVIQIQKRISQLTLQQDTEEELEKYRGVYLNFAKILYDAVKDKPLGERYARTQMYASALIENAKVAEALPLFQELEGRKQAQRDAQKKKIDDEYAARRSRLAQSKGNPLALAKMANETVSMLGKYGITPEHSSIAQGLVDGVAYLSKQNAADPAEKRVEMLADRLKDAYTEDRIPEMLKRTLAIDATNIIGLARCYWQMKKYDDAIKMYTDLLGALDPSDDEQKKLYWKIQLDLCTCAWEGYQNNPKALQSLRNRIRTLGLKDKFYDGRYGKFNEIMGKIKSALDKGSGTSAGAAKAASAKAQS